MTSSSLSVSQSTSRPARRHPRIFAVELLRLLAIVGIAVFHTFLLMFDQIVVAGPHALAAAAQAGAAPTFLAIISSTPAVVWLISMLMFLGAWGNHIFFMISAFFLVPRLAERSHRKGFARDEWKPTMLRIAKILAAVVFYVVVLVIVNRWIVPIQAVGGLRDVIYSLEFVWLYVLFVLLAPFIGWCIERCRKKWCVAILVAALAVIYGLNVDVAISGRNFFDSLSVLDWRKQMSAVTYLASYICAGALGCAWRRWYGNGASAARNARNASSGDGSHDLLEGNTFAGMNSSVAYSNPDFTDGQENQGSNETGAPFWLTRRFWAIALAVVILAVGCIVAFAAFGGHYGLLMVLSFKSTSAISFLLAVCSLMCAACPSAKGPKRSLSDAKLGSESSSNGDVKSDGVMDGAKSTPGNVTGRDGAILSRNGGKGKPFWINIRAFCRHAVEALASGILGFYIVQALTYYSWIAVQSHFADPFSARATSAFAIGGMSASVGWLAGWFLVEVVFSLAFVLLVCLIDRFVRQPLLRLIKLA
ncbi:acyltransferase family protein [Bifidobacterium sp. ESL0775]|uniref:acyltransferase family protein n=1 Tax=Bifidobacterium sp. ESL0775 TaxID=2983230 RepID=UPI0023F8D353|nr:acyltransferase family protein [Bifidobacterium sp. ESL0775]WEV69656.1 acyltransferase family protein [Bifidobacterium sp. ESL0775]